MNAFFNFFPKRVSLSANKMRSPGKSPALALGPFGITFETVNESTDVQRIYPFVARSDVSMGNSFEFNISVLEIVTAFFRSDDAIHEFGSFLRTSVKQLLGDTVSFVVTNVC